MVSSPAPTYHSRPLSQSQQPPAPAWPGRGGLCPRSPRPPFHTCLLTSLPGGGAGAPRAQPRPLPIPAHAAPALPRGTAGPATAPHRGREPAPGDRGVCPRGTGASAGSGSPARPLPAPWPGRMKPRDAGARPGLGGCAPASLTHPEPAAVVALMELMRSRLAVSFSACSVCWSGL